MKEFLREIEGWEQIPTRMKEQNKGLMRMSRLTGLSTKAVMSIRDGEGGMLRNLLAAMEELGLKFIIVPDEDITPEVMPRKGCHYMNIDDIVEGRRSKRKEVKKRKDLLKQKQQIKNNKIK